MCTELCFMFVILVWLAAYIGVLALLAIIVFAAMRLLEPSEDEYSEEGHECEPVTERAPLQPLKPEKSTCTYGACHKEEDDEDTERGSQTSSSLWSSEELYDEKMCMICYDEERNCFFVPCGHCAT